MRCGPGNSGQCVGPKICCGESFGCYMGTEETSVCGQENDSTTPCTVRGEPCGSRQLGTCVANGFCCDSEACSSNSRCMAMQESKKSQSSKEELLNLIQRLLKSKNYD
ncbi:hypothetical protein SNE40_017918 [Patella caerulea]|uniref:Uncharacterized protein n=1 Tax=Patella caerulea TaxID=87958 RepID=A0AAN8PAK5_PATCE